MSPVSCCLELSSHFHLSYILFSYALGRNYPQQTDQSVANNGNNVDKELCNAFDTEGRTHGLPGSFVNHIDYGNLFVGHYSAGDIQYSGHHSAENVHLMYWKETKNFQNGCGSHIINGYYSEGDMLLPDQATFIFDNTVIDNNVLLNANHHCNVGITGFLCMPQYVLHNVKWKNENRKKQWVKFQDLNFQFHSANQNHVSFSLVFVCNFISQLAFACRVLSYAVPLLFSGRYLHAVTS